ncbi:MAG: cupin domain-containing protein [Candidatus Limnocylindrales bacterium]|jgi:quercetin dioxygenase-like cupin family protein
MDSSRVIAVNGEELPWQQRYNEPIGKYNYAKDLFKEPETGMEIRLVRYPAGLVVPWHTHPCGHGIYVLDGTLQTHEGTHGPGSFIWFPEGEFMEHGATAKEDVTVLFITNKSFDIYFRQPSE